MSRTFPNRRLTSPSRAGGFTIVEVVMAMFVLSMMALMCAAVIPAATRSSHYTADYSQAQSLVMHKINQVQEAGYTNMNGPGLGQSGQDVVDGTPTSPTASANAGGSQSASFEFTTTDNLWRYFPGGANSSGTASTASNRPRGFLSIAPYSPSSVSGVYDFIQVTITVQWTDARGRTQNYGATTLVARNKVI